MESIRVLLNRNERLMSIVEGLKKSARESPGKVASICGSTRLTFREVDERVNRLSSALTGLGIARGDRVAILSLNCHRFFELYYGVAQLGAIVVPINFRLQPQEIKYIVDHSGAKIIAVDPALAPLIEAVRPQLESVEHFILMSDERREGYLAYEELLASGAPGFDAPEVSDDELLGLFYTSGTTAEPKGVMLTHATYKVPRSIEFIEGELPKGGTGKILKKQLRERYWKDRARRIS